MDKKALALLWLACFSMTSQAEDDVHLGSLLALSGPSHLLGTQMEAGMRAYFDGREAPRISLTTLDDGYRPRCTIALYAAITGRDEADFLDSIRAFERSKLAQSVESPADGAKVTDGAKGNVTLPIDRQMPCSLSPQKARLATADFVGFVGNVGTPTVHAIQPHLQHFVVGAYTGSSHFRLAPNQQPDEDFRTFNLRASYLAELQEIIAHISTDSVSANNIAILAPDSEFGNSVFGDLLSLQDAPTVSTEYVACDEAASQYKLTPVKWRVCYQGGSNRLEEPLQEFLSRAQEPLKAIIVVGSYRNASRIIAILQHVMHGANFYALSFVGYQELLRELQQQQVRTENVIVSRVVPPFEADAKPPICSTGLPPPVIAEFKQSLADWSKRVQGRAIAPTDVSFEGFLTAKYMHTLLRDHPEARTTEQIEQLIRAGTKVDVGLCKPLDLMDQARVNRNVWLTRPVARQPAATAGTRAAAKAFAPGGNVQVEVGRPATH